jgi:Zn-dependent protease with chaperone function
MSELAFPLLGAAFVFFGVLPACAAATKLVLARLERRHHGGTLHGLDLRFLLLTSATFLPIAWFMSAGLHQAEARRVVVACSFEHVAPADCLEPTLFVIALGLLTAAFTLGRKRSARPSPSSSVRASAVLERVLRIVGERASLEQLSHRLVVTETPGFAVGVQGVFFPRVVIGCDFAEGLTDDALAACLGHEAEHVSSHDPLRYEILSLALALNPLGRRFLSPHAAQWFGAREAHCDREAVIAGANPLQLAEAIVRAARPGPSPLVALGAPNSAFIRLRVSLLLAFAERMPVRCCKQRVPYTSLAVVLLLTAISLPHETSTAGLDLLHVGAEGAVLAVIQSNPLQSGLLP